jgi:hypothetical protein
MAGSGAAMMPPPRYASLRAPPRSAGLSLDLAIVGLTALAITAILTLSSSMLSYFKIQYVTTGGSFYEKLHPATYLIGLAFFLQLIRTGNPVRELLRVVLGSRIVLFYLACWVLLLMQTVLLGRPFTGIVDAFMTPLLFALVIWQLTPQQRQPLVWVFHLLMLLNIAIGYYEYVSGHRIIPLMLGDLLVVGEWRSAALLGLPLTASGLVAAYLMALFLCPRVCPLPPLRFLWIAVCLASLMVFGGRTALVMTLAVMAIAILRELFRMLRGGRVSLPTLILAICTLFVAIAVAFAALDLGVFDKMLLRFSSDKGSTLARYAMINLLSYLDWSEVMFGSDMARANALQNQLGLQYGIENFWISCIVQYGLLQTALLTTALGAFLTKVLRNADRSAFAILLLMIVIAASSVSFSSKNIQLAQFIILITVLLPRAAKAPVAVQVRRDQRHFLALQTPLHVGKTP